MIYLTTYAALEAAAPVTPAGWVRKHWSLDNRLCCVRDVTFDEDRSPVRAGHPANAIASLRTAAIGLSLPAGWSPIGPATQRHARSPGTALTTLLISEKTTFPDSSGNGHTSQTRQTGIPASMRGCMIGRDGRM